MNTSKVALGAAIIALVLGGVALFQKDTPAPTPSQEGQVSVGGQFEEYENLWFQRGLTVGDSGQADYDITFNEGPSFAYVGGSLQPGSNISYWQNTTGAPVYVDEGVYGFSSGTASTTYQVSMFATTTAPATFAPRYAYTALTEAINGSASFLSMNNRYATSSTATTTNSFIEAKGNRGNAVVTVPNNGYLIFYMQNIATGGGGPLCNGAVCETATSSNRGINPFWKARYVR